jgi:MOSC domain-containing protein YiiM
MMITIDPDTAQETSAIMRNVARSHGGNAGIYCAVMTEGMVRLGASIVLLD